MDIKNMNLTDYISQTKAEETQQKQKEIMNAYLRVL
jgi:hypothetical protein